MLSSPFSAKIYLEKKWQGKKRVLVAYGNSMAMAEDLPTALAQVVGLAAPVPRWLFPHRLR